jgi:hypothetical protein
MIIPEHGKHFCIIVQKMVDRLRMWKNVLTWLISYVLYNRKTAEAREKQRHLIKMGIILSPIGQLQNVQNIAMSESI